MVRGKQKEQRTLTMSERADIEGLKKEAEGSLRFLRDNPGTARSEMIDTSKIKKEVEYYEKVLADGAPKMVRGANKDRLVNEAKELEELMKVNMPTRDQMDHPANNPGAVHKHMKWLKDNESRVRRYKEIMRQLEPDDPTVMDIDKLRREK